jgi:threonine dehydratase
MGMKQSNYNNGAEMNIPPELKTTLEPPTLADVYQARKIVYQHIKPTPLLFSEQLSQLLEASVYVKCENLLPTGAFKVRGGLNLIANLSEQERKLGVITASTGNHGQSIAYAARAYGVRTIIGAPLQANTFKLKAMQDLGAEVVQIGKDFDEAREWVAHEAANKGYRYIHSGDEPLLIAGIGTASLEIIEEVPDLDFIFVPLGGGSGACGHCIGAKGVRPEVEIIGVQAEGASAVYQSFISGQYITTATITTFAEGLATRVPFALPYNIMREHLDDVVLVSDPAIRQAIKLYAETIHQIAEGAGAAPLAAALNNKERIKGKKVALILSGGNITLETLRECLNT